MEVTNGIIEMEELLDLIAHQLNSWKIAGEKLGRNYTASVAHSYSARQMGEQKIEKRQRGENTVDLTRR